MFYFDIQPPVLKGELVFICAFIVMAKKEFAEWSFLANSDVPAPSTKKA
jgi:hypothetical protein